MKLKSKSDGNNSQLTQCTHELMRISDLTNRSNYFCKSCGAISFNKIFGIKFDNDSFTCSEINPLEIFEVMKNKNSVSIIKKNHKINNSLYYSKRNGMINSLRRLCAKLKFSQKAFYHSIYYSDLILHENAEVKIDLTGIACLLIAGNF